MWTAVEDIILDAWATQVLSKPTQHLSLHFDGILVSTSRVQASSDFKAECENAIRTQTGYIVNIVHTPSVVFSKIVLDRAIKERSTEIPIHSEILLKNRQLHTVCPGEPYGTMG